MIWWPLCAATGWTWSGLKTPAPPSIASRPPVPLRLSARCWWPGTVSWHRWRFGWVRRWSCSVWNRVRSGPSQPSSPCRTAGCGCYGACRLGGTSWCCWHARVGPSIGPGSCPPRGWLGGQWPVASGAGGCSSPLTPCAAVINPAPLGTWPIWKRPLTGWPPKGVRWWSPCPCWPPSWTSRLRSAPTPRSADGSGTSCSWTYGPPPPEPA